MNQKPEPNRFMTAEEHEAWIKERNVWGYLGKPPDEVINGPPDLLRRWKDLSREARRVASMPRGKRRTEEAKNVELKRESIIFAARDTEGL